MHARTARCGRATRLTVKRAHAVVAVSAWLLERLVEVVPEAVPKSTVIDCGVDLDRFAPRDVSAARSEVGWSPSGTGFLCVGSLSERKNVLRLARAFERRGEGSLAFVGDGPLRPALEGRPGIHLAGRVDHDRVAAWIAAADVVCQPSLTEPFGLATLEGLASGRSVVATRVGGPPEFVPPGCRRPRRPLRRRRPPSPRSSEAALLPRPNLAAREAAEAHDVRRQAERVEALLLRAAFRPPDERSDVSRRALRGFEIGEPELDEGPNCLLEPSCASRLEGREVALPHLLERDSLLESVVPGHEEPLDRGTSVVRGLHVGQSSAGTIPRRWSRSLQSCRF